VYRPRFYSRVFVLKSSACIVQTTRATGLHLILFLKTYNIIT